MGRARRKWGSGAFMRTVRRSADLAKALVESANVTAEGLPALQTDMNQPLGRKIGNALKFASASRL